MQSNKTEMWSVLVVLFLSLWIAIRSEASEILPLRNAKAKRSPIVTIRAFSVPVEQIVMTKKDSRKIR